MHTHRGVLQDDVSAFLGDQRLDVFLHVSIWSEEHSVSAAADGCGVPDVSYSAERTRLTANRLTTRSLHYDGRRKRAS